MTTLEPRLPALRRIRDIGLLPILLVLLAAVMIAAEPRFLTSQNVLNVLRGSSFLIIVAAGQMLVLVVGGFDLSVGAVMALTSVASALAMAMWPEAQGATAALSIAAGVAAGLGCGLAFGLLNGLCVAFLRIPPFMVTLGTASIASGAALLLANGVPVYGLPTAFVAGFGRALWLGLPPAIYAAAAVVLLMWVAQSFTRAGVYIFAVGGNLQAAVVSGIKARAYIILAYVLCSMLASLASLLLTAQIGSGQGSIGDALTLQSIGAAVIAGVSLRGGVGRVQMVALGAIFLLLLNNAMDLLRIQSKVQAIFLGVFIVLVVAVEELGKRREQRD